MILLCLSICNLYCLCSSRVCLGIILFTICNYCVFPLLSTYLRRVFLSLSLTISFYTYLPSLGVL